MGLDKFDFAIIALYLVGITLFGLRFRKRQRSLRDYFLADRSIPWWAIALSIVAAETSTLTIISIPGHAYDTNFTFLQVVLGYLAGRVIISFVLLPHYFRGDLYTAYELIERRFGRNLRSLTAGLFLIKRAAAEGVGVYAGLIVVGIALGTGEIASIAIITALTLIYTFEGGLAAVIWTDVVQTVIYVGGTLVGLFTIIHLVPGGWIAIQNVAAAAGKFHAFDFSLNFWKPYTFWAGLIGGAFLTTASHGTDQLIVQRLLAARNQRQSVAALLSSGIAILFQFVLFGLAVLSLHKVGRVVEVGLQIASVAYGALLGVFLLGVLTRRANQSGTMLGMLCGFSAELYIWLWTRVPWTWYVMIGTVVTFGVGYAASAVFRSPGSTDQLPTQNL